MNSVKCSNFSSIESITTGSTGSTNVLGSRSLSRPPLRSAPPPPARSDRPSQRPTSPPRPIIAGGQGGRPDPNHFDNRTSPQTSEQTTVQQQQQLQPVQEQQIHQAQMHQPVNQHGRRSESTSINNMTTLTSHVRATNEPGFTDDNLDGIEVLSSEPRDNPEQGSLRSEQLLTDLITKDNLDKMVSVSKNTNELLIDLDYEVVVDDATGQKSKIFRETPFNEIYAKLVESKNLKLMNHPVVESVLTAKWNSIKVAYIVNLVLYAIFVAILTCHFTLSTNNPGMDYYIDGQSTQLIILFKMTTGGGKRGFQPTPQG